MGADLSVRFTGLRFENPFLLSSAPPTESDSNILRAFDAGWGGVVTKTIGLHPVTNVAGPKTKFMRTDPETTRISMQKRAGSALHSSWNWELISDKTIDWWLPRIARIKQAHPHRILVASIMAGSGSDKELAAWQTLAKACQEQGADAFELNLSCPHMDRKDMGSNIGKDQALIATRLNLSENEDADLAHVITELKSQEAVYQASLAALAFTFVLAPPPRSDRTVAGPSPMTAEERRYFAELTVLLDDGIANRRHVDGVLKSEASAEAYTTAFEIYRARQDGFLRRLDALSVPARLKPAHDAIRRAAERQVGFYRDFKDGRIRDPRELPNLLDHSDLRESDYDLHRAWDFIRQTYPVLDPRLAEAIERRLCSFDIV